MFYLEKKEVNREHKPRVDRVDSSFVGFFGTVVRVYDAGVGSSNMGSAKNPTQSLACA